MWRTDRLPPRLLAWTAGVCLGCLAVAQPARGQFNGDPFDPFRAAYRSSSLPVDAQFAPGQARRVVPPGLGTVPGIGTPWDVNETNPVGREPVFGQFDRFGLNIYDPINDEYRRYDEEFGRVYRPNSGVDENFYEEQRERQQLYVQAMRESDPQRRAELLRRYRTVSRRASLGLSPSASRGALDTAARREETDVTRRGAGGSTTQLPQTVRSYEDLVQWSRVVNREALRVGVVRSGAN